MRRRTAWVAGLIPLLALRARPASAQMAPGGQSAAVAAPVVELVVVAGGRDAGALLDTARDLLGRVGMVVEAHAVATLGDVAAIPHGAAAVRVQVDLRAPGEAVLLTEGRRQAPRQRTLRRDPSPTVAREELAQAIESAVESQLFADPERHAGAPGDSDAGAPGDATPTTGPAAADAAPPPSPAAAPASAPPPPAAAASSPVTAADTPPRASAPSSLGLDVSTLAGTGGFASPKGPVVALEGDVTLASRKGWRPSLSLSARSVLPFDATSDSVTSHTSALALRALGGVELARTTWLALDVGAGGGAELQWATPRSAVLAPSVLGGASTRADPMASAFVAAHVALVPSVTLSLLISGDVDLAPSRYVVVQGTTVDPVLQPWRVRPTLLAGFTFTALGRPAFAAREGR